MFLDELNTTRFAGFDDWRLPRIKELQSMVDYHTYYPAASFPGEVASDNYWSSTTNAIISSFALNMTFYHGYLSGAVKDSQLYVRAVRGGW